MESQVFARGQAINLVWQAYGSSVQMIVVSPVLKLLSNATTDDHFQLIRVNSHVSLIEQGAGHFAKADHSRVHGDHPSRKA